MHSLASPRQPTGTAAAAFGMPMPLASLMANGDAGDAITLRIVAVTRNQIDYAQRIEKDKKENPAKFEDATPNLGNFHS